MKLVTIVGARPQFIKAAPLSRALRKRASEVLVHTGQHYDAGMSDIFFAELDLPTPDYHLGVGSGRHGAQTGAMLAAIEEVLLVEHPDGVLVYGDTNSTLAGALAAAKLHLPIAHVEAGLRSFNRVMPEEINRVLSDHLSHWLFAPTEVAKQNLAEEGITRGVHVVGDIMIDAIAMVDTEVAPDSAGPADNVPDGPYFLGTVHRAENTDDPDKLRAIFAGLGALGAPVVLPLHPRTRARLAAADIEPAPNVCLIEPVGYVDMLRLQRRALCILTDSGGIQKEAYALGTPCVTLRQETEWVETVAAGWNRLCAVTPGAITEAVKAMADPAVRALPRPPVYGDGHAAERIVALLTSSGS